MSWQSDMHAALRHPSEPKVLFLCSDRQWNLPKARFKGNVWAGNADVLVPAFAKRLGTRPWILVEIRIASDREAERIEGIFEMIITANGWEPPRNSRWVDRASLENLEIKEERLRPLVDRYLADLEAAEIPAERSPWSSPGWLPEVQPWIEKEISRLGHRVVGFEQVKHWSISTVLRVKTTSSDFYFKVSKNLPLFVNEAVVTARLAGRFPGLRARSDCHRSRPGVDAVRCLRRTDPRIGSGRCQARGVCEVR